MAGSVNKVILVGHLGKDPEVNTSRSGDLIANLSVATSESWKDRNSGERKERTEWHRVVIFNPAVAKVAQTYLRKGSKVYVEGQLATRKWTGQDGQDRYATEILIKPYAGELVLLDRPQGQAGANSPDDYGQARNRGTDARGRSTETPAGNGFEFNDEIPF